MKLKYAYNTNGTANHRLSDALALISDAGYDGVALTLDHHHFDPFEPDFQKRAEDLIRRLDELNLDLVVETGARFLLDPRSKHSPTLLSPDREGRQKRIEFLKRAVDLAEIASAEAVSFWAGVPCAAVSPEQARQYLCDGLSEILEYAAEKNVVMAFEPEPGMLVETIADFKLLKNQFPTLRLALDTGHCLASDECEPEAAVLEMRDWLGTVAIEDMRRGVHEHVFFGDGEMNVRAVLRALREINFEKLICVELSRDSHRADKIVPAAIEYLRKAEISQSPNGESSIANRKQLKSAASVHDSRFTIH